MAFSLNCRDEDYTDASVTFSYFDVTAAYVRKPRFEQGSAALSRCNVSRPRRTVSTEITGASFSEATVRPNPRFEYPSTPCEGSTNEAMRRNNPRCRRVTPPGDPPPIVYTEKALTYDNVDPVGPGTGAPWGRGRAPLSSDSSRSTF